MITAGAQGSTLITIAVDRRNVFGKFVFVSTSGGYCLLEVCFVVFYMYVVPPYTIKVTLRFLVHNLWQKKHKKRHFFPVMRKV